MHTRHPFFKCFAFALTLTTGALLAPATFADETTPATQALPADHSGKNVRDRASHAATADSQAKGSRSDVEITREIRQMIQKEEALSMSAKNVKIITQRGMVTLRGPVANAEERAHVATIAQNCAGVQQVKNHLEVKR